MSKKINPSYSKLEQILKIEDPIELNKQYKDYVTNYINIDDILYNKEEKKLYGMKDNFAQVESAPRNTYPVRKRRKGGKVSGRYTAPKTKTKRGGGKYTAPKPKTKRGGGKYTTPKTKQKRGGDSGGDSESDSEENLGLEHIKKNVEAKLKNHTETKLILLLSYLFKNGKNETHTGAKIKEKTKLTTLSHYVLWKRELGQYMVMLRGEKRGTYKMNPVVRYALREFKNDLINF